MAGYALASISESSIGLDKITSRNSFDTILSGGTVPPASSATYASSSVEKAAKTQLIMGSTRKDVFFMPNGTMLMFYGDIYPKHLSDPLDTMYASNGSAGVVNAGDGLFVIASRNCGLEWGSPRMLKPDPSNSSTTMAQMIEWSTPLCLMYEFKYAGIAYDTNKQIFNIFGYVYLSGATGYNPNLTLSLYSISYANLGESTVYPIHSTVANTSPVVAHYRTPLVNPYKQSNRNPQYSSIGEERFSMPFGNSMTSWAAQSIIEDQDPLQIGDPIGITGDTGLMTVYLKNNQDRGSIFSVYSLNGGIGGWKIKFDSGSGGTAGVVGSAGLDPMVYADGADFPTIFQGNLFFFQGNSLYMVNTVQAGTLSSSQVSLDSSSPRLIASNLPPQRVAARTSNTGEMEVYYLSSTGTLAASYSSDDGYTWKTLQNW